MLRKITTLQEEDEKWKKRSRFKSNLAFINLLDEYIENMSERIFKAADYACQGKVVSAEWIQERFAAYKELPVKRPWNG